MKAKTKVEVIRVASTGPDRWGVTVNSQLMARGQCRTMQRRARGITYGIMDHKGRCHKRTGGAA